MENQDVVRWAFDPTGEDPAVYVSSVDSSDDWSTLGASTFSAFVFARVFEYQFWPGGNVFQEKCRTAGWPGDFQISFEGPEASRLVLWDAEVHVDWWFSAENQESMLAALDLCRPLLDWVND